MTTKTLAELTTVTLTGADDANDPAVLAALSAKYPFVEWGILIGSHSGQRFPSVGWIKSLLEERVSGGNTMRLSLHICGRHLRDIAAGRSALTDFIGPGLCGFDRCQLNWHGEKQGDIAENILAAFCNLAPWEPEIIFQLDGVNGDLASGCIRRFRCSGLFDLSHGAGVLPDQWPHARAEFSCGWAGGLGPENVASQIVAIRDRAYGPFWIDMETRIRTDGRFDLAKCYDVLDQMQPFVTTDPTPGR